jgi:integrase
VKESTQKTVLNLGNVTLHIFKVPNSRFWHVGWHNKGYYIRRSLRTDDLKKAHDAAIVWWVELNKKPLPVSNAKKDTSKHFATVAAQHLELYKAEAKRGQRSPSYVRGVEWTTQKLIDMIGTTNIEDIDTHTWTTIREQLQSENKALNYSTLHMYENALQLVLKYAVMHRIIKSRPKFEKPRKKRDLTPRAYFTKEDYRLLRIEAKNNEKRLANTRWKDDASELRDYIILMVNSGLRVGEAKNVKLRDIKIVEAEYRGKMRKVLIISNIKGKRGGGICRTWYGAYDVFMRLLKRRGLTDSWQDSEEKLFLAHHRDMFAKMLDRLNLRKGHDGVRRDFVCLRHTYICYRLMDHANINHIADNCRTSPDVIRDHYAARLTAEFNNDVNEGKSSKLVRSTQKNDDEAKSAKKYNEAGVQEQAKINKKMAQTAKKIEEQEAKLRALEQQIAEKRRIYEETMRNMEKVA